MDNQMTKPEERPGALPPEDWDEMPGYVPTREELVHLVRYWYEQILDINWLYFTDRTIWGSDHRRRVYANARIKELTAVLSDVAVEKAIAVVENDFKATRCGFRGKVIAIPKRSRSGFRN